MKKLIIFTSITSLMVVTYLFILFGHNKLSVIKNLFSSEQKHWIKSNFFPHKIATDLKNDLFDLNNMKLVESYKLNNLIFMNDKLKENIIKTELAEKDNLNDIVFSNLSEVPLNDKFKQLTLLKFKNTGQITYGINNMFPGSGYIDIFKDQIWFLSSRGILGYENINNDEIVFKQIKNNLDDFLNINHFDSNWYSFKDLTIFDNKIFISFTDEILEDCWNTSVVFADLDYSFINFNYLFKSNECVHSKNNIDKEFNAHQSGGRIINIENNQILLSIGDYRSRHLAQNTNSVNGKIIKINIIDKSFEIFSMGHRNPQGLYFDKNRKFILETEHGPYGGDEINIINLRNNKIPNYGWAIASYGEHYGKDKSKIKPSIINKYAKYPLYKSHKDHGFIEPIIYFHKGISEITKINNEIYIASSLGTKELIFFKIKKNNSIKVIEEVKIYERIRDINFYDNQLYLFLEDTPSIGIINLNKFKI
mgnify:CR=1 FL=1